MIQLYSIQVPNNNYGLVRIYNKKMSKRNNKSSLKHVYYPANMIADA